MTAAEQGEMWGASVARAAFAGDAAKLRRARDEAVAAWPPPLRAAWWRGHDAAYRRTWAELTQAARAAG